MKGQKKFYLLLIILSLIALFSISCNNDNNNKDKTGAEEVEKDKTGTEKINKDKTEKEEVKKERKLSYYAGNWWTSSTNESGINIITINTDDSITFKDGTNPDVKIPSNSITRVSDTNYTTSYNDSSVNIDVKLTLIFSSDTQGKLTMETETETETDPAIVDITKK